MAVAQHLTVTSRGKTVRLKLTASALSISRQDKHDAEIPVHQVIGAYYENSLDLYYLSRKGKKASLALHHIEGSVGDANEAETWCNSMMSMAYKGVRPCRRLKVLVNPFGGKGKGTSVFTKIVKPIFQAAKCTIDVTYTTHSKHAVEIAKELPLKYDAMVVVSGDGLIHEIMNGFAEHADYAQAFDVPLVPVPAGSGNATSLNILGRKDGSDCAAAALNAIKGKPMKVDLFLLTQGDKTTISSMTQSLGLMADCDLGTDNWRWMGDIRFLLGYLRGLLAFKPCPMLIQVKVVETDKSKMVEALGSQKSAFASGESAPCRKTVEASLPDLTQPVTQQDGWLTFDKPALYVYAGKGPFVSRDFMQFPVSVPDDGFVDIVIQEPRNRLEMITEIDKGPTGDMFWLESQHYFKATGYRVKCLEPRGYVSVDGESYPFADFQVEVLKGLGTFLSPYGRYADDITRSKKKSA